MTPPLWTLILGDARRMPIPDGSAHCCVTSPPYWNLRKYPGQGDAGIGNEATVEEYLAHLLEVFQEVKRVLHPTGCCFVNLGDTRGDGLNLRLIPERFALMMQQDGWMLRDVIIWHKQSPMPESVSGTRWERCRVKVDEAPQRRVKGEESLLIGAASGSDNHGLSPTWSPCPGCDRCRDTDGLVLRRGAGRTTKAHEYIFMFVKSKIYYYDSYATRQISAEQAMFSLPAHEAYRGILYQSGDEIRQVLPVCGVHEAADSESLSQPGGATKNTGIHADGQSESKSPQVCTQHEKQGGPETVQPLTEGQTECSEVCPIREGTGSQESAGQGIPSTPGDQGTSPHIRPQIQSYSGGKAPPNPIQPNSQGSAASCRPPPPIQGWGEGPSLGNTQREQTSPDAGGNYCEPDSRGMADYQRPASGQMRLLPQETPIDDGSHDTAGEGRQSHQGQRNSCLPELQLEEGHQDSPSDIGANLRSVWTLPIERGVPGHYAQFPPSLPARCIAASTSEKGVCPSCGAQWARVIERGDASHDAVTASGYGVETKANRIALLRQAARANGGEYQNQTRTLSWRPTCRCPAAEPVPALVLDPFTGVGSTLLAAARLGRRSVGVELSPAYLALATERLEAEAPRF